MTDLGVLYSGLRFQHHQTGSGYDLLAPAAARHVSADQVLVLGSQPDGSGPRKLSLLLADLLTLLRGLVHPVVHYYYPEDTAFLSPWLLSRLGKRIVFTLHLDDAVWLDGKGMGRTFGLKRAALQRADVIVVLSTAQQARFQAIYPHKQVVFVPHGFQPLAEPVSKPRLLARHGRRDLLVVGENYRDFDMLANIIQGRGDRSTQFHLVGVGSAARRRFQGMPGVVVHARLPDQQFDARFDSSFAMLLPLCFATANNALLEAHKWWLPSFVSDIEGVRDYATSQTQLFNGPADFWLRYDRLAQSTAADYAAHCQALAVEARQRFQWDAVRRTLAALYRTGPAPRLSP